ncbi:hypothetical protein A2Y26_02585 [candidate division CPR2 bacterium GWD2_39_7]|nr:MAG: hypothetical protein A2Y27_01250 [candidate division CPR2 bacterium GWD1_39_7]OGB72834.1 MAG: hypothetical protein A2Y26_02585 [candidate division CPR2 bacterium GWD2_39_7]
MKRTIYLARHGETEYNRLKKITGQLDVPLNDDGIEQAMMLSIELKDIYFDAIFCSPLKRCRQTVNEVKKFHRNTPLIFDERLKECDAGILEGESTSFMEEYSENFTPRGGESYFHLKKRLRDFIEDQVDSKNYENVLVISHGGPLKVIRSLFEDVKILSQEEMSIKNCNYWIIKTDAVCTIKSK